MSQHTDPYAVLGLERGTPRDKVKARFRELAKQLHPGEGTPLQGSLQHTSSLLHCFPSQRGLPFFRHQS